MRLGHYVLDAAHTPVVEPDMLKWASWMEQGVRTVARTTVYAGCDVSTVFLGLDHNFFADNGPPILFETMVFGGPLDQVQDRYATWDEAVAGHVAIVEKCHTPNKVYAKRDTVEIPMGTPEVRMNEPVIWTYRCRACGSSYIREWFQWCPECGRKILWIPPSAEKEKSLDPQ